MTESLKKEIEILKKDAKKSWNNYIVSPKLNDIAIREIFAMVHEVNLQRDETGMPIPGTGRIITAEEKKMVFDYILDNKLPLTKKMYDLILKAYISGDLELEEEKEKTRKV